MSIFLELPWPIVDKAAVCKSQTHGGAATLTLDGTLSRANIPGQVSFIANRMIRSVSITGSGMSGVNFIIKGFQNGALVTETLAGPVSGTVYGTEYYDIIESITTSGAVTSVTVGTGTSGYLPLIAVNVNSTVINYTFSVGLEAVTSVHYTMFETLASINTNFTPFSTQTTTSGPLFPISGVVDLTTSTVKNSLAITNFLLLQVISSVDTDSFNFTFLQE
jgi:hypothetical protein